MKRLKIAVLFLLIAVTTIAVSTNVSANTMRFYQFNSGPGVAYTTDSGLSGFSVVIPENEIPATYTHIDVEPWVWTELPGSDPGLDEGQVVTFYRDFDLGPRLVFNPSYQLTISAYSEYRVFLNDVLIADSGWNILNEDTCPRYQYDAEYENYRLVLVNDSSLFHTGINTVRIEVLNYPCYEGSNPPAVTWQSYLEWENLPRRGVRVDIKPDSAENNVNLNDHGVIPVAVLGAETFDVFTIDTATLTLSGLQLRAKGNSCSHGDVNDDGWQDLICKFADSITNWDPERDTLAAISGVAYIEGQPYEIIGFDSITFVP